MNETSTQVDEKGPDAGKYRLIFSNLGPVNLMGQVPVQPDSAAARTNDDLVRIVQHAHLLPFTQAHLSQS